LNGLQDNIRCKREFSQGSPSSKSKNAKHWKRKHRMAVPGLAFQRTGRFSFLPLGTLGTQLPHCEYHKPHGKEL
jgi:hypothetical protein